MTPEQVIRPPKEIRTADVEHAGSEEGIGATAPAVTPAFDLWRDDLAFLKKELDHAVDGLREDSEGLKDQLRLKAEAK